MHLWISVANLYAALPAVVFGHLFFRFRQLVAKVVFCVLWLLFLPNVAYLFTDVGHLGYQWTYFATPSEHALLIAQYAVFEALAIILFTVSMLPFESILRQAQALRRRKTIWLVLFNFLVGLGVVVGRFGHLNSSAAFMHPWAVASAMLRVLMSAHLLVMTLLWGGVCNFIYFLCRSPWLHRVQRHRPLRHLNRL